MRRPTTLVLVLAALAAILTASTAAIGAQARGQARTVIKAAFNTSLEKTIVVDGQGRSVYMFVQDVGGTPTCTPQLVGGDLCYTVVRPVTGTPRAGAGIDGSRLGTTTRSDGRTQSTYYRRPLYYFRGGSGYGRPDKTPGDLNGQGFYRMFYVLSPNGTPIRKLP
jgi:predicted lipoprotein with Yx(FWY)xxD motif